LEWGPEDKERDAEFGSKAGSGTARSPRIDDGGIVGLGPAPPLDVSVQRREVVLAPSMASATARDWPSTAMLMKVDQLCVKLRVDVGWAGLEHLQRPEAVLLPLTPQVGARVSLGGSREDAEHWVPIMLTGEQTVSVLPNETTCSMHPEQAPRANVLRAMCTQSWTEEPEDDSDDVEANSSASASITVTGGKGLTDTACCLSGFALRAHLNITATLYLAPPSEGGLSSQRRHTLLVSGTGTLELRPRLVDFRCLGLSRLLAAAQEDARRGDNFSALQKWRHALPRQEEKALSASMTSSPKSAAKGASESPKSAAKDEEASSPGSAATKQPQKVVCMGSSLESPTSATKRVLSGSSGRESSKLAFILHSMGVALNTLGEVRESLFCLRRALAIRQQLHGEDHPDSARTLQALGVLRVRDGEYHEAFEYFWVALRYYEAFEPETIDCAVTLQAIAGVYGKIGEFSEALECYVRALPIRERELGKDHPDVAATLHNLGVVLEKLSDHDEALDNLTQALSIRERRLGVSHPQTARTLHSIGIVYSQIMDYTSALAFYERALSICRKRPGEGTHAAATLNNMGVVYAKLGQTQLALEHHEQALAIQEHMLGSAHCDTCATRYNLQVLHADMEQESKKTVLEYVTQLLSAPAVFVQDPHAALGALLDLSADGDGPVRSAVASCSAGCHNRASHQSRH
jgi:tetratricopeptide (TPR) repeat protein